MSRGTMQILHLAEGIGDPDEIAERVRRKCAGLDREPQFGRQPEPAFRVVPVADAAYDDAIVRVLADMRRQGVEGRLEDRARALIAYDKPTRVKTEAGANLDSYRSTIRLIEQLSN